MNQALYDLIGVGYATRRRPDARIAGQIDAALGSCHSVVNVGAALAQRPVNRLVVAVEPSGEMIRGSAPPPLRQPCRHRQAGYRFEISRLTPRLRF